MTYSETEPGKYEVTVEEQCWTRAKIAIYVNQGRRVF